jgi:hypothetical protein
MALVVLLSRNMGPPRTFNFLLPLLCGWSAAGWGVLLRSRKSPLARGPQMLRYGTTAALALTSAFGHVLYGCYSAQDVSVDQAENAARFITERTPSNEPVLSANPYDATLMFYGLRHGMDVSRIAPVELENDTALIVWDERHDSALEVIDMYEELRHEGLLAPGAEPSVEELAQFGSTHVGRIRLRR